MYPGSNAHFWVQFSVQCKKIPSNTQFECALWVFILQWTEKLYANNMRSSQDTLEDTGKCFNPYVKTKKQIFLHLPGCKSYANVMVCVADRAALGYTK